ncbi:MAG: hypothetical protein R2724_35310 [Bryobacterales bacterium]
MYTLLPSSLVEQARERQVELQREAETYRLRQQAKNSSNRIPVFRWAALAAGDLLIMGGAWLKQRAQIEAGGADLQPVSGRFLR